MGKGIRIGAIVVLIAAFIGILVMNTSSKPTNEEKVWDTATTLGNIEAKNYYVMYTDLACPYCDVWSRAVIENKDDFKRDYIEGKDILYEVRVTEFLYEYGEHAPDMSHWSAKGTYCAAKQNKFWEYYEAGIMALWNDYHSKGIGTTKGGPTIDDMEETYWTEKVATTAGVAKEEFSDCYGSDDTDSAVKKMTEKAARNVESGLPYYVFNSWTQSGFDQSWDYSYVRNYLEAGLKK